MGARAFGHGPSSAAGLSDRRICAGGLAGFLTGWAGRTFRLPRLASGSTDQPMWRKLIARYLLLARAILPLLRHTRGAARGRRKSPRRLLGLGSAAFSPFYCDKNPDGERPAFWKTGFRARAVSREPAAECPPHHHRPGDQRPGGSQHPPRTAASSWLFAARL